ncbi:hypothetical protein [Methanobrevibacter sp.]
MEENNFLSIGNITTIINTVALIISGYLFAFLTGLFGGLPFTELELAGVIGSIIGLIFGYINAKNHNTFWDKKTDKITFKTDNLTTEQINLIQDFIDNVTEDYVDDIDPASEYEDM